MKDMLGNGLLVSEGENHRIQKRGLLPAFTRRQINLLYPVFCAKARETIMAMTTSLSSGDGSEMDIANWASRYALDVIGLAGFAKDFGAIHNPSNDLVKTYKIVFDITKQKRALFFLGALLPWKIVRTLPLKHNRDFSQATKTIRDICQEIIQDKRAMSNKSSMQKTDLLSIAMESRNFSDEDLVDQVMTFLGAGHETTASILTWAVYALALHPEIQQQLREEIRNSLVPLHSGSDYSSDTINRLPFLQAVCNEVLRMFPPVRLTMREAAREFLIQGVTIPCGTKIMVSSYATNMDENLWGPDAADFNPYRWLIKDEERKQ
jgi:cytochrome P450